jgi:hypothetical protein
MKLELLLVLVPIIKVRESQIRTIQHEHRHSSTIVALKCSLSAETIDSSSQFVRMPDEELININAVYWKTIFLFC